eukprot:TRINITY_DN15849_c0_g2_i2.p1 TRINITY_DN15849_c0_g2~~TRINITY_DN15849_c0_g2_i2.p1  ORF type:complete len:239 (-),score=38.96 TRINITY_DN15849_c0_g2_i2:16-732(-)
MRHLDPSVHISLIVDEKLYKKDKPLWDAIPLPIQAYTTNDKRPYLRGAQVFLAAVNHTASVARKPNALAKWTMFIDDDSWMDFGRIHKFLQQKNYKMPKIFAKGGPTICGGFGITFSQRALQMVKPDCINPCGDGQIFKYGDLALSFFLGLGRARSGAVFNEATIYGYDAQHPPWAVYNCEKECVKMALPSSAVNTSVIHNLGKAAQFEKKEALFGLKLKPSTTWKPAGHSVNFNTAC